MYKKEIYNQEIIRGDCLDIMKTLPKKSFDTLITSPPYNLNIKYNTYDDNLDYKVYLSWIKKVFVEAEKILTDDSSIFLNIGATNIEPWIPYDIANQLRDLYILQNDIIWVKSISIDKESYGHYKPINSGRYLNHMYEHIFHFTKKGNIKINRKSIGVPYKYKCNLKAVTVTEDIRCRGNTWFIPYETIHKKSQKGNHPAIFPVQLAEWCIKLCNGKKIIDPFVGTGTTLIASKNLGCFGTGIEIDEEYFKYAITRITSIPMIL